MSGRWTRQALRRALRPGGRATSLIKGEVASEPAEGLVRGFSASGQDVWLQEAAYDGPGLILSAVGARCGKVFEANGKWGVVANTSVLIPQPGFDPHFLWYLVNDEAFWEKGGTAQPYVRVPDTLARRLTFPPLQEQRAIAKFLDTETARIDTLITKRGRMIELLREHYDSDRASTVLCGLDPVHGNNVRPFPTSWRVASLGVLLTLHRGFDLPTEARE